MNNKKTYSVFSALLNVRWVSNDSDGSDAHR